MAMPIPILSFSSKPPPLSLVLVVLPLLVLVAPPLLLFVVVEVCAKMIPAMVSRVSPMLAPRATMLLLARLPPPLLLLAGPDVDVDVLEAPCATEEVEVPALEDDGDKE